MQALSQAATGATQLTPAGSMNRPGRNVPAGSSRDGQAGSVLTVNDFLLRTGLDNLNLFKLVR